MTNQNEKAMDEATTEEERTAHDAVLPPPEDFDLASWIGGVRSTVRSVTIYKRADLLAEIEETERALQVAQQVAEAGGDEQALDQGYEVGGLTDRLNDLYEQFVASGVTFRVEARSPDWLANVERDLKKSSEVHGKSKEERIELVNLHQLAGSIIQPQGVTVEALATLREVSNTQYRVLLSAFFRACGEAPGVSVPFSRVSSGRRGGRRS